MLAVKTAGLTAQIATANAAALGAVKDNHRLRKEQKEDREVLRVRQRAPDALIRRQARNAEARPDQKGVYLQDDLLEDIDYILTDVKDLLKRAEMVVFSAEAKKKMAKGAPLRKTDFQVGLWADAPEGGAKAQKLLG